MGAGALFCGHRRAGPAGQDGLLRLHSTYRHDLKIYASDEGRVQMTAAAFTKVRRVEGRWSNAVVILTVIATGAYAWLLGRTKGFLDLEGELPPILVSLVIKVGRLNKGLHQHSRKLGWLMEPAPSPTGWTPSGQSLVRPAGRLVVRRHEPQGGQGPAARPAVAGPGNADLTQGSPRRTIG